MDNTFDIRVTLDQDGLVLTKKSSTNTIKVDTTQVDQNLVVVGDTKSSPDIRISKDNGNPVSGRIGTNNALKVVSAVSSGSTISSIYDLDGLDFSDSSDGNVLVYDSDTNIWESVDEIDGGFY